MFCIQLPVVILLQLKLNIFFNAEQFFTKHKHHPHKKCEWCFFSFWVFSCWLSKKEYRHKVDTLFLARLKGFEPPIFRIGICCVIQLRHRRMNIFYYKYVLQVNRICLFCKMKLNDYFIAYKQYLLYYISVYFSGGKKNECMEISLWADCSGYY